MNEISVEELKRRRDAGEDLILLDVREPDEIATASIPWSKAIPMTQIAARYAELPHGRTIVCMCHHGSRSERVGRFLEANGYDGVFNLTGGIDAWAVAIDPRVPRY